MTKVIFESATVSDVLKRASKFAPKSDKTNDSPGIFLHVTDGGIVARATDLEIFTIIWSTFISKEGPAVNWHMPISVARFCEHLSHGTGKTIEFNDEEEPGYIVVRQLKAKGSVPLIINNNYPNWEVFTEEDSSVVQNLGSRLDQVRWATAGKNDQVPPPLQGVFFDGEYIMATDKYVAARVPVAIPSISEPITINSDIIAEAIRHDGDVRITRLNNGIGISPDAYTQIFCRSYGSNPVAKIKVTTEFEKTIEVNSENMCDVIQRMLLIAKDKELYIKLTICNEEVTLSIDANGSMSEDVVDVPGFATWETPDEFYFDPNKLLSCLSKTPTNTVKFSYTVGKGMVYVSSGTYEAWVAKKEVRNGSKAS